MCSLGEAFCVEPLVRGAVRTGHPGAPRLRRTFGQIHFFALPGLSDVIAGDFDRNGDGDAAAIADDDGWRVAYVKNRN